MLIYFVVKQQFIIVVFYCLRSLPVVWLALSSSCWMSFNLPIKIELEKFAVTITVELQNQTIRKTGVFSLIISFFVSNLLVRLHPVITCILI